jgi:hypothetical protein
VNKALLSVIMMNVLFITSSATAEPNYGAADIYKLPDSADFNKLVIPKKTEDCIPPKSVEAVPEALQYYTGCTLNQFMEITGLIPEASVSMPNELMLYKFVGRAGDGYFTTRRTCIINLEANVNGQILRAGFQSAAQSIILNGRGHCLKILRGKKREGGINTPLMDIY